MQLLLTPQEANRNAGCAFQAGMLFIILIIAALWLGWNWLCSKADQAKERLEHKQAEAKQLHLDGLFPAPFVATRLEDRLGFDNPNKIVQLDEPRVIIFKDNDVWIGKEQYQIERIVRLEQMLANGDSVIQLRYKDRPDSWLQISYQGGEVTSVGRINSDQIGDADIFLP